MRRGIPWVLAASLALATAGCPGARMPTGENRERMMQHMQQQQANNPNQPRRPGGGTVGGPMNGPR
jgi:hypothetical protein